MFFIVNLLIHEHEFFQSLYISTMRLSMGQLTYVKASDSYPPTRSKVEPEFQAHLARAGCVECPAGSADSSDAPSGHGIGKIERGIAKVLPVNHVGPGEFESHPHPLPD